ncbi:MAG: PHP domain-containing protein [Candidatus Obscuribacterales bacterium]|jgi:predicted metal-dependent phosphoesterase TrpH|nr:PHP domain-containing protein [Candidatus Obscuribacterales bacterium]
MSADLHLHTHHSDGNWTTEELINRACELGLETIAITDHDTTAALAEGHSYAEGKLRLIDGIEFNTTIKRANGKTKDVHILGYFINKDDVAIKEMIQRQQFARRKQVEDTVAIFNGKGYELTFDDVARQAGKGSIGRPHICKAMMAAGIVNDASKAYRMLMNYDSEFRVERESISPHDAIAAISHAGGISSLAHPGKDKEIEPLVAELASNGLNAIEAFHRSHTLSMVKKYQKLARKLDLLITGGSDCHGPFEGFPGSIGTIRLTPDIVRALESFISKNCCAV